jgi:hypothetical protein
VKPRDERASCLQVFFKWLLGLCLVAVDPHPSYDGNHVVPDFFL